MSQILESIWIALQSIWANKLRSFLTVLGNIVAVTSIVTVVSLIQGLNATVSGAIVGEVGADTFVVQRQSHRPDEADEERTRAFPLITRREADAIRAFSPLIQAVVAQAQTTRHRRRIGAASCRACRSRASRSEYLNLSMFDAELGRVMSPSRSRAQPAGGDARLGRRR